METAIIAHVERLDIFSLPFINIPVQSRNIQLG